MYCLLALTTLTFFSCQKDTDVLTAKTKNLIGNWEIDQLRYIEGQEDVRHPEVSVAETSDGTPFRIEINKNKTFKAFGDGIFLTGTYTAKRAKGEYYSGKKFRHGYIELDFDTPSENYSASDHAFITILRKIDGYIFNGEDLTIYSSFKVGEGWTTSITFEKR